MTEFRVWKLLSLNHTGSTIIKHVVGRGLVADGGAGMDRTNSLCALEPGRFLLSSHTPPSDGAHEFIQGKQIVVGCDASAAKPKWEILHALVSGKNVAFRSTPPFTVIHLPPFGPGNTAPPASCSPSEG